MKKTILTIVIILVLVIGFSFFFFKNQAVPTSTPQIQTASTTPVAKVSTTVYNDAINKFSFSYPKELSLADKATIDSQPWEYNTTDKGNLLVRVLIPKSTQPKTNFGEASFSVGVSTDTASIKNCFLSPMGNGVNISTLKIEGVNFTEFHYSDAGAGNFYDVTSYHTLYNGKCFVMESMVHSSNIGNYSPDQGITEFNKDSVNKTLEDITNSFKFN